MTFDVVMAAVGKVLKLARVNYNQEKGIVGENSPRVSSTSMKVTLTLNVDWKKL